MPHLDVLREILHFVQNDKLTLPLFVAGILADDANNILALHDLARFTKSFY